MKRIVVFCALISSSDIFAIDNCDLLQNTSGQYDAARSLGAWCSHKVISSGLSSDECQRFLGVLEKAKAGNAKLESIGINSVVRECGESQYILRRMKGNANSIRRHAASINAKLGL